MLKTTKIKRRASAGIVTVLALGAVVGVGLASGATSTHRKITTKHAAPASLSRTAVSRTAKNRAVLARSFPVFNKARVASAGSVALPVGFAEKLAQQATNPVPPGGLAEPDPSMAVYVGTATTAVHGTVNVWAMPGANDLCMATLPTTDKGGSVECASDSHAAAGELLGADEGRAGSSTVIGLLPGSPASVTVQQSNGASAQVSTTNGLWVVNNDPRAVSASTSSVSGTIPIP